MRNVKVLFFMLGLAVVITGCESMGPKTKGGAAIGGLVGAAAGGIIGHQSGHGWEGALIGGAAGALGGGLIGNEMDKKATATNPEHISIVHIAEMASQGVPDDVIISEIDRTRSTYILSAEITAYLRENNVSERVVNYMQNTVQ